MSRSSLSTHLLVSLSIHPFYKYLFLWYSGHQSLQHVPNCLTYSFNTSLNFLFSKVLFIDPSKACLGDFVAKARSPRMGSKHTESQMEKNSMWSLLRYCSFLGNELTSHLYSLSPILIVFPFHFLSPSSPPFFILFALSVLEVKIRTLFVLGKLFYH